MKGSITATCGHKVESVDDLISVTFSGEECDAIDGFYPCVHYVEYCPPCAEAAKLWPEYLIDQAAIDDFWESQRDNEDGRFPS
jgi:hypothetical protein